MIIVVEAAWLEYQVRIGQRLDLEKLSKPDRDLLKAVFEDGFNMGIKYASPRYDDGKTTYNGDATWG